MFLESAGHRQRELLGSVRNFPRFVLGSALLGLSIFHPGTRLVNAENNSGPKLELSTGCTEGNKGKIMMEIKFQDNKPGRGFILQLTGYYQAINELGEYANNPETGEPVLEETGEVVYPVFKSGLRLARQEEKDRANKFGLIKDDKPIEFNGKASEMVVDLTGKTLFFAEDKYIKAAVFEANDEINNRINESLANLKVSEEPIVEAVASFPRCDEISTK